MPTYEYRCQNGHDSEHFFRKFSDAPSELACPVCQAEAVRRVSGGAGLLFKGSGFYLTDYGKNAHRKDGAKSDGKSESKSEGKLESKSESKSEATGGSGSSSSSDTGSSGTAAKAEGSKPSESKASSSKGKSGDGQ